MKETDDIKRTYNVTVVKNYKKKPGPKTVLNESLFLKIREAVMQKKNGKQIAEYIGVPYTTFCTWRHDNYQMLADKLKEYEHHRALEKSFVRMEALTESEREEIAFKASEFFLETVGKKDFSRKEANINIINMPTPILGNMFDDMARVNVIEHEKEK